MTITHLAQRVLALLSTSRARWIAAACAAGILLLSVVAYFLVTARGCSSRENVTARVSLLSSGLQEAAAQNRIKVEELAAGIRRLNAAATTFEATKDHQAYCEALDELTDDYKLE